MTSKDKTGNKLVASIRKSKTGTVAQKTSERPDAGESMTRPKPDPVRKSAAAVGSKPDGKDSFSFGRRVWPD